MATSSLKAIHSAHSALRQEKASLHVPAAVSAGFAHSKNAIIKPTLHLNSNNNKKSVVIVNATTAESTGNAVTSLSALRRHVEAGEWREADEETRRLLIELAGEASIKRGYVFFSEVQYIPTEDLRAIDDLWVQHSGGRFGYSVQKKIFNDKSKRDFTSFFIKVGWMKKLDSLEVDHYNYRAFPSEFMWEITDQTPMGHLPLTNALRGTQLLNSIFDHPAFDHIQPDTVSDSSSSSKDSKPNTPFKTTYTF